MSAEGISSENLDGLAATAVASSGIDDSALSSLLDEQVLEAAEVRLRRVNSELGLSYAVEQQIAGTHELPALITQVLGRVQALMRFELAAALITGVTGDAGAEVFAVTRAGAQPARAIDADNAQRLISHARTPIRRAADTNGSVAEVLAEPPGVSVTETYSAPLSDGRSQIGILQIVNASQAGESEDAVLRKLGLAAAQLGRALVLRREREATERAERLALVGHSISAILHDMRTPLMAVSGCVDMMASEDARELRSDHAARAARALEQLERMVQEVLHFARGQREVHLRNVQLPRFVDEVREMLLPEVAGFSAQLDIQSEYSGPARFDEHKLKRVLWDLARNACQAGADKVALRVARAGETLLFECTDTGPGISKVIEGRLFESFATHGKSEATGLGLAMAKKIVDAHCGRISVNSTPPNGTVFRIEIPI
jgi:signal transduction histidine kinase